MVVFKTYVSYNVHYFGVDLDSRAIVSHIQGGITIDSTGIIPISSAQALLPILDVYDDFYSISTINISSFAISTPVRTAFGGFLGDQSVFDSTNSSLFYACAGKSQ